MPGATPVTCLPRRNEVKGDCRAARHRLVRRSTSSFGYTANAGRARSVVEKQVLSILRCDPIDSQQILARHGSPGDISRAGASPAIDAMTIDQSKRPTLQHVSCPAANASTNELHKIRLVHFKHDSTLLCKATSRNAFMAIRALLAFVAR